MSTKHWIGGLLVKKDRAVWLLEESKGGRWWVRPIDAKSKAHQKTALWGDEKLARAGLKPMLKGDLPETPNGTLFVRLPYEGETAEDDPGAGKLYAQMDGFFERATKHGIETIGMTAKGFAPLYEVDPTNGTLVPICVGEPENEVVETPSPEVGPVYQCPQCMMIFTEETVTEPCNCEVMGLTRPRRKRIVPGEKVMVEKLKTEGPSGISWTDTKIRTNAKMEEAMLAVKETFRRIGIACWTYLGIVKPKTFKELGHEPNEFPVGTHMMLVKLSDFSPASVGTIFRKMENGCWTPLDGSEYWGCPDRNSCAPIGEIKMELLGKPCTCGRKEGEYHREGCARWTEPKYPCCQLPEKDGVHTDDCPLYGEKKEPRAPFTCEKCGRNFDQESLYGNHMMLCTKGDGPSCVVLKETLEEWRALAKRMEVVGHAITMQGHKPPTLKQRREVGKIFKALQSLGPIASCASRWLHDPKSVDPCRVCGEAIDAMEGK